MQTSETVSRGRFGANNLAPVPDGIERRQTRDPEAWKRGGKISHKRENYDIRIKTYFIRSCFTLFALFRVVRQIFLQAFPLLDQLLPVLLNHSVILVQILIRKIAQSLVVVRHAQRFRVLVAWRRFVLVDGSTQH